MDVNRKTRQVPQTTNPPAWQFSAAPTVPKWPQGSSNTNFTSNDSGDTHFQSGDISNTWNFPDDSLWNTGIWEDWDLELGDPRVQNSEIQGPQPPGNQTTSPNLQIIGINRIILPRHRKSILMSMKIFLLLPMFLECIPILDSAGAVEHLQVADPVC
jgi:hypothetical protein